MLTKIPPKIRNRLLSVVCPYCSNTNLLLIINFKDKWEGKENIAFCIKKVVRNVLGIPVITGCGRKFKLEILPRKEKQIIFPPL